MLKRLKIVYLLGAGALAVGQANIAHAQASDAATTPETERSEEIIVTGTLIRGVAAPTGAAVLDVSSQAIRATGATSAGAVLNQTVPQLPTFNSVATGSADFGAPVTKIGLRGIGNTAGSASGQTATLVLFNGHRIVPVGILSTDPDPDLLPADILEAVQVMPDGGSATYGSDAIGGVVNFVTRKRFDGVQVRYEHRFADNYNEDTASTVLGKDWGSGGAYVAAFYNRNDEILGRDRDYIVSNFTSRGGGDYRGNACPYGQFTVGGTVYSAPSFTAQPGPVLCEAAAYSSFVPKQKRLSVFGYVEQELGEGLKFSMDAIYSRRDTKVFTDVSAFPATFTITAANPSYRPVAGEASQTVTVNYARAIGNSRITPQVFEQYQFSPNLVWSVDDNWELRAQFLHGKSFSTIHNRAGLNGAAVTELNVNAYDPSLMAPSVIQNLTDYELYSKGVNGLTSGQLIASGSLFELPGGALKVAFGGEVRRQTLDNSTTTGRIGDFSGLQSFKATRTVKAAFAEIFAPIVSDDNGSALMRQLSINVALRYDHYSDFGATTNPRFGIDYKPFNDLLIRGNYQTSFVAPSLADSGNKIDTRFQILQLIPNNYLVFIAGAGQNLKPEEGESFSIGADWTPSAVRGLRIGATYWNTKIDNLVSLSLAAYGFAAVGNTPFSLCGSGLFGSLTSAAGPCTAAFLNSIQPIWGRIDAGAAPGITNIADLFAPGRNIVNVIDARRANFGTEKISGLDFNIGYTTDTAFGSMFAEVAGSYLLTKKIAPTQGAAFTDYLSGETVPSTSRYNIVGSLGGSSGAFTGRITVRHNAGVKLVPGAVAGQSRISSFTLADLFVSIDIGKVTPLKETLLTLTVQNLFDRDPPFSADRPQSAGSLSGFGNGGTLGRTIGLGLQKRF